jgi:hypothetical protein
MKSLPQASDTLRYHHTKSHHGLVMKHAKNTAGGESVKVP